MAVLARASHVDGAYDKARIGDLVYRLVEANDAEAAYRRALALGEESTETYTDDDGVEVVLKFLGLADLAEIPAERLGDGVEVYSALDYSAPSRVRDRDSLSVFESAESPSEEEEDEEEPPPSPIEERGAGE
jgi:hypothetical protein